MQGYWTSFIRSLNPNTYRAPGSPVWETFSANVQRILFMTNATKMETVPEDQKQLVISVISMTPEQILALPPQERATYVQIVSMNVHFLRLILM